RKPYQVGDRIRIGEASGDVVDVGYLDTTLWEFGGPLLSTDHSSGRIINYPNSKVLDEPIYNYSWPQFPYVGTKSDFMLATTAICSSWPRRCRKLSRKNLARRWLSAWNFFVTYWPEPRLMSCKCAGILR